MSKVNKSGQKNCVISRYFEMAIKNLISFVLANLAVFNFLTNQADQKNG